MTADINNRLTKIDRRYEMRLQSVAPHVKIRAIKLIPESLEIVERVTFGSIRGIKLPREKRVVMFYQNDHEYTIEIGEILVQFVTKNGVFFQIWNEKYFHDTFQDIDEVTY